MWHNDMYSKEWCIENVPSYAMGSSCCVLEELGFSAVEGMKSLSVEISGSFVLKP